MLPGASFKNDLKVPCKEHFNHYKMFPHFPNVSFFPFDYFLKDKIVTKCSFRVGYC